MLRQLLEKLADLNKRLSMYKGEKIVSSCLKMVFKA